MEISYASQGPAYSHHGIFRHCPSLLVYASLAPSVSLVHFSGNRGQRQQEISLRLPHGV